MALGPEHYSQSPESLLVGVARRGDRDAFAQLVARRQNWIRNLMRRLCRDEDLADDLAQQAFLQAWRTIHQLNRPSRFAAWLKRIAINTWLQHIRKADPLKDAEEFEELPLGETEAPHVGMDLDRALSTLPDQVRFCVVLSYHEGMTHEEIAKFTGLPLGTVKSHIRRGTARLRAMLPGYDESTSKEQRE